MERAIRQILIHPDYKKKINKITRTIFEVYCIDSSHWKEAETQILVGTIWVFLYANGPDPNIVYSEDSSKK